VGDGGSKHDAQIAGDENQQNEAELPSGQRFEPVSRAGYDGDISWKARTQRRAGGSDSPGTLDIGEAAKGILRYLHVAPPNAMAVG